AGESRDVLLTQSAHAADFTKFQYEIHADFLLTSRAARVPGVGRAETPQLVETASTRRGRFSAGSAAEDECGCRGASRLMRSSRVDSRLTRVAEGRTSTQKDLEGQQQ